MQVKAIKPFYGAEGNVRRGAIVDVESHRGQALIKRGLAVPVAARMAEVAEHGATNPMSARNGGRTGAARSASSSPQGRAPQKRTSPGSDAPG